MDKIELEKIIKEKYNDDIKLIKLDNENEEKNITIDTKIWLHCYRDKTHDEDYKTSVRFTLHPKGKGCIFCDNQLTTNSMIEEKLKEKFNNKIKLKNKWNSNENHCNENIIFICEEHGEFKSTLNMLFNQNKHGCKKCGDYYTSQNKLKLSEEKLKNEVKLLSNNKYTLKENTFKGVNKMATFICEEHGEFDRKAGKVLYEGKICCPSCKGSNGELFINNFLLNNNMKENIDYYREHKFDKLIYKRNMKFDFYLPKFNLLIEFDGKQHWDNKSKFYDKDGIIRDNLKDQFCKDNNLSLIRFIDNSKTFSKSKQNKIINTINNFLVIKEESSTTIEKVWLFKQTLTSTS